MVTPKFYYCLFHVFVFKMHTFKIFQNLHHRNIFEFKEIEYTTGVFHFSIQIHEYKFMSSQGNNKGFLVKGSVIFMFYSNFL